ncbi:MAG: type I-MYXAN CRISPR-associated protein Cas5/Cmx5/DevS [Cyanobacteria bacterium P01_G01_bin.54]
MTPILYLDCPCTSFPRSFARDYKETYRYPPPSTLYGFLLSLVGEEDLMAHLGVKLAIGIIGEDAPISRIVRKQRHHKFSKQHLGEYGSAKFSKPNLQELLTDLKVVLKLDSSEENREMTLEDRVAIALSSPEQLSRFGGLSLGESWAMVNGIRTYRPEDGAVRWLKPDSHGLIALPKWIDRTTTRGTFERFTLTDSDERDESFWVKIEVPEVAQKSQSKRKK